MSNKPVINGKKSVESSPSLLKYSNYQQNMLDIPDTIRSELKSKGYEGRWINYNQFLKDGNFHKEGWVPYRPDKSDTTDGFFFGQNPDGIIRRKELVLAFRPKEICESHRLHLRQKANQKNLSKKAASDELRQMAKDGRFSSHVKMDDENDSE